jgi:hypothetical protein
MYQCIFMLQLIILGWVFFGEFAGLTTLDIGLFSMSIFICTVGVILIAQRPLPEPHEAPHAFAAPAANEGGELAPVEEAAADCSDPSAARAAHDDEVASSLPSSVGGDFGPSSPRESSSVADAIASSRFVHLVVIV